MLSDFPGEGKRKPDEEGRKTTDSTDNTDEEKDDVENLGAFFASQKTGLSAPIPRNRLCDSCGISAAIPCAAERFL
jgi:hypothetical protein